MLLLVLLLVLGLPTEGVLIGTEPAKRRRVLLRRLLVLVLVLGLVVLLVLLPLRRLLRLRL